MGIKKISLNTGKDKFGKIIPDKFRKVVPRITITLSPECARSLGLKKEGNVRVRFKIE